ncbi:zinc metallopeptidase [Haloferula sp. BvORR071]|uniref:zinc metallopeptidase n=1 Tax=Haloferula sp. BvORR071 TaxID=1396141 RepID=UPI0009DE22B7|nr:zinc metallopeptidase [Haloferula sp. BvORR071]
MTFEFYGLLAQFQQQQPGGGHGIGIGYWLIIGASFLLSMAVSGTLKRRFAEYSQIPMRMTGAQVAEAMLRQNGINDVQVISVPGHLTDHYNPANKTVNLSEPVYHANSVAAAAVAAHECGHAVQHQQAYAWLGFRSAMVPVVNIASTLQQYLMLFAFGGLAFFKSPMMLMIWAGAFVVTALFAVVTLPVEFDASRRALVWLEKSGVANQMEHKTAKNALFWAAMTYVSAAIGAIAQAAYLVMMLLGQRDNRG